MTINRYGYFLYHEKSKDFSMSLKKNSSGLIVRCFERKLAKG